MRSASEVKMLTVPKGKLKCDVCDLCLTTPSNLRKHLKRKHKINVEPLPPGPDPLSTTLKRKRIKADVSLLLLLEREIVSLRNQLEQSVCEHQPKPELRWIYGYVGFNGSSEVWIK